MRPVVIAGGGIGEARGAPNEAIERYERIRKARAEWVQRYSREAEELFNMSDPVNVARRDSRLRENQKYYPSGFPEGQQRIYGYDADAALAGVPA